jgi:Tol biopolymer transport system component
MILHEGKRVINCLALAAFLVCGATAAAQGYKLNDPLAIGDLGDEERVSTYHFTPDGARVVFLTNMAPPGPASLITGLFSVPVGGTAPAVRLNGAERPHFAPVLITPDSSRVVYLAGSPRSYELELYTTAVDGSQEPMKLSRRQSVATMQLTPDGTRVVFLSDTGLYVVPTDGSNRPVCLEQAAVDQFQIAHDGSRVVYMLGRPSVGPPGARLQLLSVPISGGAPLKLNRTRSPDDYLVGYTLTSTGQVVYAGRQEGFLPHVYSVPMDGSALPIRISDGSEGIVQGLLRVSPDGRRVVYYTIRNEYMRIYSAQLDGSSGGILLHGPVENDYFDTAGRLQISPASDYAVFLARDNDGLELYSALLDGSQAAVRLSVNPESEEVMAFCIAPDTTVLFWFFGEPEVSLYGVPIDGSSTTWRVSDPSVDGGFSGLFALHPDGERVVYMGTLGGYITRIDGGTPPQGLEAFGEVSPIGTHLVFVRALCVPESLAARFRKVWRVESGR